MTDHTHLARALIYRSRKDSAGYGEAQAALRRELLAMPMEDVADAAAHFARLMEIRITDMPPSTDDVSLLLDALAFRIGVTSRADAWRAIGINPNRGRDLLARNSGAVDWPIWKTLRDAAVG